jgi:predicted HAD superfamily Cof-like phosphohydrolase
MSNSTHNMTDFQKVKAFNNAFGLENKQHIDSNVFETDPKLIKFRMSLITEEVQELNDAVEEKDIIETIDALADIVYVVHGMAAALGIDLDYAFDIVHKSNMSKLCNTEADAVETVSRYTEKYKNGDSPYDSPNYRKSADGKYWVVFNESTGKILKSYKYTPANFSNM